MYTGYFAKLSTYVRVGLIPISICGKAPDWYQGLQYKKFAPKWSFFNEWKNGTEHKGDNDYYIEHFNSEVLDKLNFEFEKSELKRLTDNQLDRIILICYEKPEDFCHRHLIADWFNKHNLECKEYILK